MDIFDNKDITLGWHTLHPRGLGFSDRRRPKDGEVIRMRANGKVPVRALAPFTCSVGLHAAHHILEAWAYRWDGPDANTAWLCLVLLAGDVGRSHSKDVARTRTILKRWRWTWVEEMLRKEFDAQGHTMTKATFRNRAREAINIPKVREAVERKLLGTFLYERNQK